MLLYPLFIKRKNNMVKIKTYADLQLHKAQLNFQIKQSESSLETNWLYIKQHYKAMIWQQINPFKNSNVVSTIISAIEPSLIPVIASIVIGATKDKPISIKTLVVALKYAVGKIGLKWLEKWVQPSDIEKSNTNDVSSDDDKKPTN